MGRQCRLFIAAVCALLFIGATSPFAHASTTANHAATPRIVSTNICIDNILIQIFGTTHLVAVSNLVDDPLYSQVPFLDPAIERISFDAENILRLRPSLVLISNFSNHRVVKMLRDSGVTMVTVPFATKLSDISQNIQIIGNAIQQNAKAKIAAEAIRQQLGIATPKADQFALHVTSNNYIYGRHSLISDAVSYAGLAPVNEQGFGANAGFYNVESIIASNPDHLIVDDVGAIASPNLRHDRYHQALKTAFPHKQRIKIDPRLWSCAHQLTPQIIDMIKQGMRK